MLCRPRISIPKLLLFLPFPMRILLFLVVATTVYSATSEHFTPKERAQRFSDRVILAKPKAQHRATVDAAETRDRVRVRNRFSRLGDVRVIEIDAAETVARAIERLNATGRYEFVEPDYLEFPDATPNDASFPSQWSLNNTGQLVGSTAGADIKAVPAWDIIREAPDVIVAMVDSGINIAHRDIAANLWRNPSPTFGDVNGAAYLRGVRSGNITDTVGHGTHVAGIIGAVGNNTFNIAGIAWKVQLMALKNSDASGGSFVSDSAACIDYAVSKGAHIINCSFGGDNFSQTLITALRAAREAGIIVVTSAGNDGANNDVSAHFPSNYLLDNIVSVANSGPTDLPSGSSAFGGLVDLYAPGTSILSLDLTTTGQVTRSGTSMAAPHVTGALALLKARFPNDTYRQLINRLLQGVDRSPGFTGRAHSGGRLNLLGALTAPSNRPFNDDFATRATIVGSGITFRANNTGATAEPSEPAHGGLPASTTLWWQWTAPSSGPATLSTTGSGYDTVIAVYSGSAMNALTLVASNDDANGLTTSQTSFVAQLGVTYHIAVSGKNGAVGPTVINFGAAPGNDDFAQATALASLESTQMKASTFHATLQAGEPRVLDLPGGGSVWLKWVAPRNGRFQVAVFTVQFDPLLGVYTGDAIDRLTLIASSDDTRPNAGNTNSLCTFQASGGTTYYFKVDCKDPLTRGEFTLNLTDSLWQFSTEGNMSGAPAVAPDGTIYMGGGTPISISTRSHPTARRSGSIVPRARTISPPLPSASMAPSTSGPPTAESLL
jgi:subtilisin family serine protease